MSVAQTSRNLIQARLGCEGAYLELVVFLTMRKANYNASNRRHITRSCLYKCPLILNCYEDESIQTPPLGTYCISPFMFVSYHVMRCKGRCCLLILALQTVTAETWQLTLLEGKPGSTACHRTWCLRVWGGHISKSCFPGLC